jgi:Holliday junction resolvase RusA-like endonuclease
MEIKFVVPGQPVAKQRPKFARRGNFVSTYTPEKTVNEEKRIQGYAREAMSLMGASVRPIELSLHFCMTIPASWSKKRRLMASQGLIKPTSKPDLDNCVKLISDALNEKCWKDDAQVIRLIVQKDYSDNQRVVIFIKELDGEPA